MVEPKALSQFTVNNCPQPIIIIIIIVNIIIIISISSLWFVQGLLSWSLTFLIDFGSFGKNFAHLSGWLIRVWQTLRRNPSTFCSLRTSFIINIIILVCLFFELPPSFNLKSQKIASQQIMIVGTVGWICSWPSTELIAWCHRNVYCS